MNKTKEITEGAITSSIFIIILLISIYTPFGLVSTYILPVPFIIYGYKNKLKPSIMLIIVNSVLASLFAAIYGLLFAVVAGIIGTTMGSLYKKGNALVAVVGGIISNIAGFIILLAFFILVFDINFINVLKDTLLNTLNSTEGLFGDFANEEQLELVLDMYKNFISNIGMLAPFMFISYSLIIVFINHIMSALIMKKMDKNFPQLPPLKDWKFPRSIIFYYLITVLIININSLYSIYSLKLIAINLFPLLQIILIIQGISFVFFFAYNKKLGKTLPILSIIGAFLPLLSQIIHIIGMVDLGFDVRKKIKYRG